MTAKPISSAKPPVTKTPVIRDNFWQKYTLAELNHVEWEALCDGCGACCLIKFVDEDYPPPEAVEYTDVACKLLDCSTGYCTSYADRHEYVPDCISLTPDMLKDMMWLPSSCAYKRLHLGLALPKWHLLLTGDKQATASGMRQAGVGVAGRCVSETTLSDDDMEDRVIHWIDI